MSLLPFLVATLGGGLLALVARRNESLSTAIAVTALAVALGAAAIVVPGEVVTAGGAALATTDYGRLFLLLGAATGLGVVVVGLATTMARELPPTVLLGLGAAGVALMAADPLIAVMAAAAGSFVPVLVTLAPPRTAGGTAAAARQLRAVVGATALALLAVAWTLRPLEVVGAEPAAAGLALLGMAGAVAVRWGSVPFHRWAARLADATHELGLPVALVWGAAVLAVVVLAQADATVGEVPGLGAERAVLVTLGLLTLVVGVAAAYLHEDLEHIVTYAIVADAGIVLFAFAALDPATWGPGRLWLLGFVATRTAFAAWAAAARGTYGARRLRDLGGWARRSPILAVALLLVAAASIGWPGLAMFDARSDVIRVAAGSPLGAVAAIAVLAHLGYFARILAVGLGRRTAAVAAGPETRLYLPGGPSRGRGSASRVWRENRPLAAAAAVLILALIGLFVAAGGLGGPSAAAGGPPRGPTASPTPSPVPSASPSPSPSPTRAPSTPVPTEPTEPSAPASPEVSPSDGASPAASGASAEASFVPISPAPSR